MPDLLAPPVDQQDVGDEQIDDLIRQAEELCSLASTRSMFTPTEVMNLMLDMRAILIETRGLVSSDQSE